MVTAFLESLNNGGQIEIVRSPGFDNLDPSEKGGISFHFAMASTVAIAKKKLGFRAIVHFDSLMLFWKKMGITPPVALRNGGSRPDLVGFSVFSGQAYRADYLLRRGYFECKGRSNGYDPKAMASARRQLGNIIDNSNNSPLKVASQFYFDGSINILTGVMEDPPVSDIFSELDDLEFASSILAVEAMEIIELMDQGYSDDSGYISGRISEMQCELKIEKEFYQAVREILNNWDSPDQLKESFSRLKEVVGESRVHLEPSDKYPIEYKISEESIPKPISLQRYTEDFFLILLNISKKSTLNIIVGWQKYGLNSYSIS